MNNCEHYEILVSAWLDDQLERAEQVGLLDHLVRCPACRRFYVQARGLDGLLAAIRTPASEARPSPRMWERIAIAAAAPDTKPWWQSPPAWALRAAAVIVLAVGLGLVFIGFPVPQPTADPVVIGGNAGDMTEARFFELAEEVMSADHRYQLAMYRVMEQVIRDTSADEASSDGWAPRGEGESEVTDGEVSGLGPA